MTKPNGVGRRKGFSRRAQLARDYYARMAHERRCFMETLDYLNAALRRPIADECGRLLPIESLVGCPLQSASRLKRDLPSLWALSPYSFQAESARRSHLATVTLSGFLVVRVQPASAVLRVQRGEGGMEHERLEVSA